MKFKQTPPQSACPSIQLEYFQGRDQGSPSFTSPNLTFNPSSKDLFQLTHKESSYETVENNRQKKIPDAMQQQHTTIQTIQSFDKRGKDNNEKVSTKTLKKKIVSLQMKIEELERQIISLRRNEHQCQNCRSRKPDFYQRRQKECGMMEQIAVEDNDDRSVSRNRSTDSIQFQQVNLHSPLLKSPEMEEKMWIFLGLTLIAMGSKVTDCDGTINAFKILKNSVDEIRRQVQRCQQKVSLEIFCSKQQIKANNFIDGMNYDPFYSQNQHEANSFFIDQIKLQSVEQHQLYYDFKYKYNINYEALLTIMEYAKNYCSIQ